MSGKNNRNCGHLYYRDIQFQFSPPYEHITLWNMRGASYPCWFGDSGGGVHHPEYPVTRALGVQSALDSNLNRCIYGHLDYAMYPWGLTDVIKYWD